MLQSRVGLLHATDCRFVLLLACETCSFQHFDAVVSRVTHALLILVPCLVHAFSQVLLFEGSITLLVPLQEAVQTEKDRAKFPTVYRRVILCIIGFYTIFGIACWMSFGNGVRTVLTTSLPAGNLATSVQFAYSIAVIFTFPLQNFPCLEIACRSISKQVQSTCGTRRTVWSRRNVIASVLVCLLAIVAAATMESLDKVVSLMGSLLGCPIAFVFPPLIHSRLDPSISRRRKVTNYIVAGLGVVAMIYSSITTIIVW